jgi:hypothetical protein
MACTDAGMPNALACDRHLLTARAERRDTRVFAHATAETQVGQHLPRVKKQSIVLGVESV